MPTALWIAHVEVTDPEAYGKYATLAGPAIATSRNPNRDCNVVVATSRSSTAMTM